MRRWFILFLLMLCACVVQRMVVRQPKVSLSVTGKNHEPIYKANVVLYWWSNPYSRLHESQSFVTTSEGRLQLEEIVQTDTTFPLMIHGVEAFHHTLCIEAVGYRTLIVTIDVLPKDSIVIQTPLSSGNSISVCSEFERLYNHSGRPRPDISEQHPSVQASYEVTDE